MDHLALAKLDSPAAPAENSLSASCAGAGGQAVEVGCDHGVTEERRKAKAWPMGAELFAWAERVGVQNRVDGPGTKLVLEVKMVGDSIVGI